MIEVTTTGVVNAFASLVFLAVAILSWRGRVGRPVPAAALASLATGGFWWSGTVAIGNTVKADDVIAWGRLLAFPGICLTVGSFVVLAYAVSHPSWVPSRTLLVALAVHPVVMTVAALTNRWHGWVYSWMVPGHLFPDGVVGPPDHNLRAPLFWVHTGYSYLLLMLAVVLVFVGWRRAPRVFKVQRFLIFVGSLPPMLINVVYLGGLVHIGTDPTTPAFALTGVTLAYALLRKDLLVLAPVARELIVDRVSDAIIAVGPDGRVLDLNPAAAALIRAAETNGPGEATGVPVGRPVQGLLGGALQHDGPDDSTQLTLDVDGSPRDLHTRWSALIDRRGREIGWVVVLRDVTELNRQRRELSRANERLVMQVETIERLRRDLAEQANRDALTGLHNRRYISEHLEPMIATPAQPGAPLSALMIDVDHFKTINDRYGHAVGDSVLVAMAETLGTMVPAGALAARWGGEEFLVVLPGAGVEAAHDFAESLRIVMGARLVRFGEAEISCTLSIGVASTRGGWTTMDLLVDAADVALYAAKAAGRNRVVSARENTVPVG